MVDPPGQNGTVAKIPMAGMNWIATGTLRVREADFG
jgi:hypothetical protein